MFEHLDSMYKKQIEATFKGTNGLGYINGQRYKLFIQGRVIWRLDIDGLDRGAGRCVYDTIGSFLDNWTDITEDVTSMRNINIDRIIC